MEFKRKIFVIFPSGSGHINPVCGLVYELCKRPDIECIFYGNEEHRELIEKTGAQFRLYSDRNIANLVPTQVNEKSRNMLSVGVNLMIDCSYKLLPQLIKDTENERPDLILYDTCFFPAKYLLEIFKTRQMPLKQIEFYPNFVFTKSMMAKSKFFKINIQLLLTLVFLFLRQIWLSLTFGIWILNPIAMFTKKGKHTKIISVFPELQPERDQFDETYKFVGACASEQARNHEFKEDAEMKAILDTFSSREEASHSKQHDNKLVYMSLGTIFHHNVFIYETVLEAIRRFDEKTDRRIKSSQINMIISVGEAGLNKFKERIANGELKLPENILLRAKVPQLEVLKRAHLFITHCGMNSTSETIKYGVPVIGIPIESDQPINANRICNELSLGIQLDPLNLKAEEISDAIEKVLSDEKYRQNAQELAKVSAKYTGHFEGARIVVDYLDEKDPKKKKST